MDGYLLGAILTRWAETGRPGLQMERDTGVGVRLLITPVLSDF